MSASDVLRIATRASRLALWQSEHVAAALRTRNPGLTIKLVPITTAGDRIVDQRLAKIGGKGLFIKELEVAILEGRADIAVHSMKDVPGEITAGLEIDVILEREDAADMLVTTGRSRTGSAQARLPRWYLKPAPPQPTSCVSR